MISTIILNGKHQSALDYIQNIQHGVDGWIEPTTSGHEFASTVCEVMSGGHPLPNAVRSLMFNTLRSNALVSDADKRFTPREKEIMTFLLQGLSHKDLPDAFKVGPGIIHTHITNLREKLNVSHWRELAPAYLRLLFLDPPTLRD